MSPRPRRPRADAPTEVLASRGAVTEEYDVEQVPAPAPPEPPPRAWYDEIGWALLTLLVLLVVGFAVWWFGFHLTSTPKRTVPAVTGKPVAVAVNELQAAGFKVHISAQSHREAPGTVFAETPPAGSRVKKGSTVQLVKSNGPSTVAVPNAVGLTEAVGRDRLVAAGFQVNEARVFSQEKAGTIVAQSPAAGSKVAKNTPIRVNVSKGSALVIVPNVVGQSVGSAETDLAKHGLTGAVQLHVPSAEAAGTVVAQNPAGGQAKRGSKVELNVSTGAAAGASGATGVTGPTGSTG